MSDVLRDSLYIFRPAIRHATAIRSADTGITNHRAAGPFAESVTLKKRKVSSLEASVIDGFALRQSANVKPPMSYPRLAKTPGQFPGKPIREIVTRPS
ncbi:MAG TPA: hypothetical protein VNO18_12065 [Xanthobacteraceae bacterium]|jgi:hypothetical protein|nr:hypothetical protein [Xanthobacteraceae bacterium]